jgi:heme-degrading monooxygenase HmoA
LFELIKGGQIVHVRITIVTEATNIDGGIEYIKTEVIPALRQHKGYQGISISGDRTSGVMNVLAQWETQADMDASESAVDKTRQEAVEAIGGKFTVERYEQLMSEIQTPGPSVGSKLHIREIKMVPAKIDENLEFFKQVIVPEFKSAKGFLAVRNLMNRTTGEGRVGTMWADEASLQAQLTQTEQRRARAAERGVQFGHDRLAEVLFLALD